MKIGRINMELFFKQVGEREEGLEGGSYSCLCPVCRIQQGDDNGELKKDGSVLSLVSFVSIITGQVVEEAGGRGGGGRKGQTKRENFCNYLCLVILLQHDDERMKMRACILFSQHHRHSCRRRGKEGQSEEKKVGFASITVYL